MHRLRHLLSVSLAALLASATGCKPRALVVLSTADEHSHQFAFAPELDDYPLRHAVGDGALEGGAARRATVLARERALAARFGVDTITVSAGDFSQGTLAQVPFTATNPDLVMLARLHYDAVAIGNHEFDLGIPALAAAITAAGSRVPRLPSLLLSNATFSGTAGDAPLAALFGERGAARPVVRSKVLTTPSGLKIGLVSQLGPAAAGVAPLAAPLRFAGAASYADKPAAIAAIAGQLQAEIDAMRTTEKVDAIVLLGHGGVGGSPAARGDDELLAAALRGVDLVVSGHTHLRPDAIRYVTDLDGRKVPVQQPAPFGREVGRAVLVFDGARPTLAPALSAFLPVDTTVRPSTDPAVQGELDGVIAALETHTPAGPSFLEATLTVVNGGIPVVDDPGVLGDLYYKVLGHTGFDVTGLRGLQVGVQPGETNALNLDTDAMWAVANGFSTTATSTEVAVQASGPIRGDLREGATGQLSFADIYNVVPLGGDPVEHSPGYPLLRFYLGAAELWGAFEYTLLASTQDSDFYLSPAGLEVVFDRSGTPFDPATRTGGWITRMTLVDRAGVRSAIFDKALSPATGGWLIDPRTRLVSVVTSLYVAAFAQSAGITPRDATGAPLANLLDAILLGPGGFHWKDHQALALYIASTCRANGGTLPATYDEQSLAGRVPRRVLCTGPVCP